MTSVTFVALLVFLAIHEATSVPYQNMNLRCRCITKEKTPIGRLIRLDMVEVNRPNSHCKDLEIIAVFKINGQKVCLDPDAEWVKKILIRIQEISHAKTLKKKP